MIKKSQNHLKDANESYFKHMGVALKISYKLILGGLMALIHAIIPSLFTVNASNTIKNLYKFVESRKKNYK